MFRNASLMLLGLERFEGASVPVREVHPVVEGEGLDGGPTRDPLGRLGLISPEDQEVENDLAHRGLVKGRKERDDLAFLGLGAFLPTRRTRP
jgi:hypothetical protein